MLGKPFKIKNVSPKEWDIGDYSKYEMHTQREDNWRLWSTLGLSSHPVSIKATSFFFFFFFVISLPSLVHKPISTWSWGASAWKGEKGDSLVCCPVQPSAQGRNRAQKPVLGHWGQKIQSMPKTNNKSEEMWRNNNFINMICWKCEIIEKQITDKRLQLTHELPWWKKGWKDGWKDGPGWGSLFWTERRLRGSPELSGRFSIRLPHSLLSELNSTWVTCAVTVTSLINKIQNMWKTGITNVQTCWLFWSKAWTQTEFSVSSATQWYHWELAIRGSQSLISLLLMKPFSQSNPYEPKMQLSKFYMS